MKDNWYEDTDESNINWARENYFMDHVFSSNDPEFISEYIFSLDDDTEYRSYDQNSLVKKIALLSETKITEVFIHLSEIEHLYTERNRYNRFTRYIHDDFIQKIISLISDDALLIPLISKFEHDFEIQYLIIENLNKKESVIKLIIDCPIEDGYEVLLEHEYLEKQDLIQLMETAPDFKEWIQDILKTKYQYPNDN